MFVGVRNQAKIIRSFCIEKLFNFFSANKVGKEEKMEKSIFLEKVCKVCGRKQMGVCYLPAEWEEAKINEYKKKKEEEFDCFYHISPPLTKEERNEIEESSDDHDYWVG